MYLKSPLLVLGGSGLVGSAIVRKLIERGDDFQAPNSKECNLLDFSQTLHFFSKVKPKTIFFSAAHVGGIVANNTRPIDFILKNLQIQQNVFEVANRLEVDRLIFFASSCIYPREPKLPITENQILKGELEPTNKAYALAKLAGVEVVNSFRKQKGSNWITLMPTNIYGPGDNFSLVDSHVVPGIIRKIYEALKNGDKTVNLWGTGTVKRDLLHSYDLAEATILISKQYSDDEPINIGSGSEVTINVLAELIAREMGFLGSIVWDKSKPDGTISKVLDIKKLKALKWAPKFTLESGIKQTIEWFKSNNSNVRF
jgi:GDP-L-fucose synthase